MTFCSAVRQREGGQVLRRVRARVRVNAHEHLTGRGSRVEEDRVGGVCALSVLDSSSWSSIASTDRSPV